MKRQTVWTMKYLFAAATLVAALASARSAWAVTEVCVASNDQLAAALVEAQFLPLKIKITQGTYSATNTIWYASSNVAMQPGTSLRGGYTANCASRDIAAGNTVLGSNSTQVANFYVLGDFTIEGLTFRLTNGLVISADNIGGSYDIAPSTQLLISRSEFVNSNYGPLIFDWYQDDDVGGQIRISDTLVHDNPGSNDSCAFDFQIFKGTPSIVLVNNTLVNNANSESGVCLQTNFGTFIGNGSLFAYNNIFYGNGGHDLFSDTGSVVLVDNVIGTHSYPTPIVPPTGTLTGDPKLDSTTYRPIESPPSPVINSGTDDVAGGLPSTDLPGRDRVVGSAPDRGAYESAVDDSFILAVTTQDDSGPGSLRAAITSANSNGGFNIITFAIGSSCGPQVITLASVLPNITSSVLINGYTQPGSSQNDLDIGDDATICVVLDGSAHHIASGLVVTSGTAHVEGLAFSGFSTAAVNFSGGSGHIVEGNHIGGSVGGVSLAPVGTGVDIGPGVSGVTVGGDDNRNRNIIGDASSAAVNVFHADNFVQAAHDNQIINNYIGVGWAIANSSFTNLAGNLDGILVQGPNNTVSNNIVGFNVFGVVLAGTDATHNQVTSNFIGTSPVGDDLGNGASGVYIGVDGHDNTVASNSIANNGFAGVDIESGQGNRLSANSIYRNGAMGIDLGGNGVTPNDNDSLPQAGDPPNRYQNFPVLSGAIGGHSQGTVSGSLTSTPDDYRIEFFASPSCSISGNGEGIIYLGHTNVTIPGGLTIQGQNTVTFKATVQSFFLRTAGEVITATAIDSTNNTSEFSACFPYTDDTIFANGFDPGLAF